MKFQNIAEDVKLGENVKIFAVTTIMDVKAEIIQKLMPLLRCIKELRLIKIVKYPATLSSVRG